MNRIVTLLLALLAFSATAQTPGTPNLPTLRDSPALINLPLTLGYSNKVVTVLNLGDSIAAQGQSAGDEIISQLTKRFGLAGFTIANYAATENAPAYTGNASGRTGDPLWPSFYMVMSGADTITWNNATAGAGIMADSVGLWWIASPAGGTFDLQVSVNGGAFATVKTLDGNAGSFTMRYTNVAQTLNPLRMKVVNSSGSNYIVGNRIRYNAFFNMVEPCWQAASGMAVGDWTNVNRGMWDTFYTNLQPALVMVHFRDPVSAATRGALAELDNRFTNWNADVVYVGDYKWTDVADTSLDESMQLRTHALARNRPYVDLLSAFPSSAALTNAGLYNAQPGHLNAAGNKVIGARLAGQLNLANIMNTAPEVRAAFTVRTIGTNWSLAVIASDHNASGATYFGNAQTGAGAGIWFSAGGTAGFPDSTKSALFGNQTYTVLNNPLNAAGPYVKQGTSTETAQFDASLNFQQSAGSVKINTAGKGLQIKEGSNATLGVATLTAGSVVVSTTAVTANSRIMLTEQTTGGTPGFVRVSARTAGTSFTITSSSGTDTSTVAWQIIEPL